MPKTIDPLALIQDFTLGLVRREGPDLTARQLCIFLIVYREEAMHTVRDLANRLYIRRADVTRSADRLEELSLLKRERDPRDRRSIILTQTTPGLALLDFMAGLTDGGNKTTAEPIRRARSAARP